MFQDVVEEDVLFLHSPLSFVKLIVDVVKPPLPALFGSNEFIFFHEDVLADLIPLGDSLFPT